MNILVVDDQVLNCKLLKAMLEQQFYTVFCAHNGRDALKILESQDIDIVLLDVVMPVMDGFETAPKIKQYAGDVYLPIIFITALEDQSSFEKCLAVGGDDFIHKPFDKVILSAKIKAHARTRRLSQQSNEQRRQLEYHYNQIEREHEIVEHIFSNALAQQSEYPEICEYHLSPASMFNGDMFLMAKSPMGGFYCLLGDFTGHGLAAAVGALPASRIFYTMVQKGMAVSDIAVELNTALNELLPGHMFCAAAIIELSSSGKSVSAWLGGLPDLYLIDQNGSLIKTIESQHMALGILEVDEFERNLLHFEVSPDQRLVMATDGIIESESERGEMYGERRLKRLLASRQHISTDQIISEVREFSGNTEQQDDLSIAIVNCVASDSIVSVPNHYSSLPFNISLSLDAKQMKTTDPVLELVDLLSEVDGISAHRSNIFLLLSEAYNNSLDHGVLGLDSEIKNKEDGFFEFYSLRESVLKELKEALIIISVRYSPEELKLYFNICDSGNGFESSERNKAQQEHSHGRGVSLLNEIAQSVSYNSAGNEVEMIYSLTSKSV
ncbi:MULTISPECIES: fused response regulator/phosphatase [Pseudoalteromonas]|uniref:fused response regulator/phosphatase n=1 Tax=Pseudoalteromonas TaxID=53246 RepID=UPI00029B3CD5|nr:MULTISPECIES: fused response regulator/phosphatase [Pseudoalteromonas]MBR8841660.1 fused response regulator/phosphatase [Pseudoalteromonas sp. JC3]NSY34515.1 fused response regulator/phosphatase [Pseudoalteromonas sp. JC28]QUI71530.1 SpoIIE family protein phosphatase [Pseudoalteromonas sp. M8]UDM61148.1 fused response regulator/phosphatase [Pseudoalteromonas piscicida]WJE07686.1 fused response regulator/phosphatase [Pseudoalteromonas sp. JC3]